MAELTQEEINARVPDLRTKFTEKCAAGEYDARDVERLQSDDVYAGQFLKKYTVNGDVDKACDLVDTVFKFRSEWKVNDQTPESFPEDFKGRLFFQGEGLKGNPICKPPTRPGPPSLRRMHFKVKTHKKGHMIEEVKRFIAFTFDQHYKVAPQTKIIVMFDFNGAGLSNMDLDVTKFIISCLSTYFPACCEILLMFEMPFLLETVWKVIRAWLDEAQKKAVTFVKKANIQEYIDKSQLEPHMIK